ncbi:exocyst complex component 3-like protein isoform X1 [Leucoraja erinacea]|uniref:exocyst complex component 3-like protein isoform X1 n=1 Tax=Leucoraja erinaceus TaxID=7782 RepID=UPI0024538E52|nr:exocyst complex component 3-like protein isoform X1 [Leucoraja erinacea]
MSTEAANNDKRDSAWPELEKAEKLARGAALKWASGIFYRPDQLERLGQYRKRETQRTSSVQSRLKSAVQSYLEGVGTGLGQLRASLDDIRAVGRTMVEVQEECQNKVNGFESLGQLSSLVSDHVQLSTAVHHLHQVFSVPEVVAETRQLIEERRLLEAHTKLMEMECWRDDILYQLHRAGKQSTEGEQVVLSYFSGVGQLNEDLVKELWDVVSCGLTLVKQDPALFVSAIRVIEREEKIDQVTLDSQSQHKFLPPGRPKKLRHMFFKVIEQSTAAQFRARHTDTKGPGLANHLAALQNNVLNDLKVVKHLMVQCCPPHYDILQTYAVLHHTCLSGHLQDIISWDLEKGEIYTVLNWIRHVYHSSPEMMDHPDLFPDVDVASLGPLVSQDALEQLQNKYVNAVRVALSDWMQKALEAEVSDWYSEGEPESDHEGYYHSSLPAIVTQMLEENVQVAIMIGDRLRDQVVVMALQELETFLYRLREAVICFGKERSKDPQPKYYLLYLLTTVNNCIAFRKSVQWLQQQSDGGSRSDGCTKASHSIDTAVDRAMKKGCRLLIDKMLLELQPHFLQLLTGSWLSGCEFIDSTCTVIDTYYSYFSHIREPIFQFMLVEGLRLVVIEYIRRLMLKKLICKNGGEREKVWHRLSRDATQLRELFSNLGLEEAEQLTNAISSVSELIKLKDSSLLSLEVSGLVANYPDISDEHVSVLLDIRGDVSKEVRGTVLEMLEQSSQMPPEDYQPIFSDILVPAPVLPFCLHTVKCG